MECLRLEGVTEPVLLPNTSHARRKVNTSNPLQNTDHRSGTDSSNHFSFSLPREYLNTREQYFTLVRDEFLDLVPFDQTVYTRLVNL